MVGAGPWSSDPFLPSTDLELVKNSIAAIPPPPDHSTFSLRCVSEGGECGINFFSNAQRIGLMAPLLLRGRVDLVGMNPQIPRRTQNNNLSGREKSNPAQDVFDEKDTAAIDARLVGRLSCHSFTCLR